MPITPMLDNWLNDAGYRYHCFISWAHTKNKEMTDCARKLKDAIEENMALDIPNPKVFLDESDIEGGDEWQNDHEQFQRLQLHHL